MQCTEAALPEKSLRIMFLPYIWLKWKSEDLMSARICSVSQSQDWGLDKEATNVFA